MSSNSPLLEGACIFDSIKTTIMADLVERTNTGMKVLIFTCLLLACTAFAPSNSHSNRWHVARAIDMTTDDAHHRDDEDVASSVSRRSLIQSVPLVASGIFALSSRPVLAADSKPARSLESLESYLYTILRVKEATIQETRLITSGKFKDAARGNVKLAVKFMLNNYRLSDAVIAASAYIDDNNRRLAASDAGQAAVQNLYTILEYFDSQDVANIKVGQDSMASKEPLVLKGLDSTRKNIDDFLAYFPKSSVDQAREKLLTENELNKKEWDPALGDIFNLPSTSV